MTDCRDPLEIIAALSAEGVRRFGDNPKAIAAFIEAEIAKRPFEERKDLRHGLSMVAVPHDILKPKA